MSFSILIAGIVGFFVGGVLNALADDLPNERSPRIPRYPDGTPRPPSTWLGTIAFLSGQRSPNSKHEHQLTWRYPMTEIATAGAFMLTVYRTMIINTNGGEMFINGTQTLFWLFYAAAFVLIVVIDIEHHLILFVVIIPSTLIAVLDAALSREVAPYPIWATSSDPLLLDALLGGAVGFGVFFVIYLGGFLYVRASSEIRGEAFDDVAFGYGDVMLSMLCGLILGWRALIFAMFITVFLGALGAAIFLVWNKIRRGDGKMTTALPYGPYIVIGAVVMLLYSDWVREFLLQAAYG